MGSSKFDKLRRVSIIKPVADKLGLKDGDEVSFYRSADNIIIRKRKTIDTNQDQLLMSILEKLKYHVGYEKDSSGHARRIFDLDKNTIDPNDIKKLDEEHLHILLNELLGIGKEGLVDHLNFQSD